MPTILSIIVLEEAITIVKALSNYKASKPKASLSSSSIIYNLSNITLGKRKVNKAINSSTINLSTFSMPSYTILKRLK